MRPADDVNYLPLSLPCLVTIPLACFRHSITAPCCLEPPCRPIAINDFLVTIPFSPPISARSPPPVSPFSLALLSLRSPAGACDGPAPTHGLGALHTSDSWEDPAPHDVKGCALAIAYTSDENAVTPEEMTVFSVNYTCPWKRDVDFQVSRLRRG